MARSVKVLDTYLRGLKRLTSLRDEIEFLEDDVAEREADALHKILLLLDPLLGKLSRSLSVREPWLEEAEGESHLEGLPVVRDFEQVQGDGGRITHKERLLAVVPGGNLVEVIMEGDWREGPPVSDTSWRVDARVLELSPQLARTQLKPILVGVLDQLKEALERGRADRKALKQRLNLLAEVDELLAVPEDEDE